jgi:hypothetical protein
MHMHFFMSMVVPVLAHFNLIHVCLGFEVESQRPLETDNFPDWLIAVLPNFWPGMLVWSPGPLGRLEPKSQPKLEAGLQGSLPSGGSGHGHVLTSSSLSLILFIVYLQFL